MNCDTVGVVYFMSCQCGYYYVGKTKRPFWVRIKEHINSIKNGDIEATVARHVVYSHRYDPNSVKFYALAYTYTSIRGGDIDPLLLCRNANKPPGLNECISYNP